MSVSVNANTRLRSLLAVLFYIILGFFPRISCLYLCNVIWEAGVIGLRFIQEVVILFFIFFYRNPPPPKVLTVLRMYTESCTVLYWLIILPEFQAKKRFLHYFLRTQKLISLFSQVCANHVYTLIRLKSNDTIIT